jgi:hypothetical protein
MPNTKQTFPQLVRECLPVDEFSTDKKEFFDFNRVVNLMNDIIVAQKAFPEHKSLSKLLEGVKSVLVDCKQSDLEEEEVSNSLAVVEAAVQDLNRKDTVKRRWRRNTNSKLSIVAKRRYWRHKNKYKRALQSWKEANRQKPFFERLQKYARSSFEGRSAVYKEDVLALMKAISSAYTHFIIGLDYNQELHEHIGSISEIVTSSIEDLSSIIVVLNESSDGSKQQSVLDTYTNTLYLNAQLWTNINLDLIGYEEDED